MNPVRIFISSVQKEFAGERAALRDYLRGDALMRRFFEVFLFEDVPAADRRTDDLYLDEVRHCDIYVGLFGNDYGSENAEGFSPTEREFDLATAEGKYRLIYVRGTDDEASHPRMRALVRKAQAGLIRKRFNTSSELVAGLYAALVDYLEEKQLIRSGPFDAAPCAKATPDDLDPERMTWFLRTARTTRRFPIAEDASPHELLEHLNLLDDGRLTNAAVLLFAKQPQRFLISSEIKCAHFHGTEVAKPIPSYQVYKGTVFDLVDA
ncbi:MAG: ATP-dependent helicase RecG, partial [Methanoculleus sp.]|nr:ATP-dependent helicase RecG [Methanoculleus sp.]